MTARRRPSPLPWVVGIGLAAGAAHLAVAAAANDLAGFLERAALMALCVLLWAFLRANP